MLHVTRLIPATRVLVDGTGRQVLARCHRADRAVPRAVGLLGTRRLEPGRGLWITPCSSIHTMGMGYAIDVAFLDAEDRLLEMRHVRPWTFARVGGARSVIEAVPGSFDGLSPGVRLRLV